MKWAEEKFCIDTYQGVTNSANDATIGSVETGGDGKNEND